MPPLLTTSWPLRRYIIAAFVAAVGVGRIDAVASDDIMATKVWLDQHLFNMTLKTTRLETGGKVWMMAEEKAIEHGIGWPPMHWPLLCFLGLGPSSIEYLVVLAQLFPELQLVLLEVEDQGWLAQLYELLGEARTRIEVGDAGDFAEARGPGRRACQAISWSVDTPPFSFYRYRELFYSAPYILGLFNMQGCTEDTRTDDADKYYCEYLYSNFQATLCGKVNENKLTEYHGEELFFPLVDSGCGENVCMCNAHSDAFHDFHFEHLCRGAQHRFMGQWGQDEFLLNNVFHSDPLRGRGVYVDVGASHPFHLSNTAYFDHCLGWRGVCLEPNPRSRPILQSLRSCEVVTACAWSSTSKMTFENLGELAGIVDGGAPPPGGEPPAEGDAVNGSAPGHDAHFEASCAPLHSLLLRALPQVLGPTEGRSARARPTIHLLSVDAEGAEIEIFKDFPFEAWDIRAVLVETSRQTAMGIDGLLLPRGFLKVAVLGKDAVYVHQGLAPVLRPAGPLLPRRIQWNEPGTDEDSIEYLRFQRLFGVDGDLDVEVGDQRLQNETELSRQRDRLDAQRNATIAEVKKDAERAAVGGFFSESRRQAMEQPWVQDALKDPQVKAAFALLVSDEAAFLREIRASARLQEKIAGLIDAGVVQHAGASAVLAASRRAAGS